MFIGELCVPGKLSVSLGVCYLFLRVWSVPGEGAGTPRGAQSSSYSPSRTVPSAPPADPGRNSPKSGKTMFYALVI